jgi:alpha-beta hydrolase superfamily lysophospholipase
VRHIEGRFDGTGGLDLYYQQWLPDGAPRLAVVLAHGAGEHSGRYLNVVQPLVEAGYAAPL